MALAVIGMAIVLAAEGLAMLGAQRRILERRAAALLELDQVLERVATTPWDQLNAEMIERLELSSALRSRAKLIAEVSEEMGPPAAKRVSVALQWQSEVGGEETSPMLVAWRYQPREATP
jgi:hypothetical protein